MAKNLTKSPAQREFAARMVPLVTLGAVVALLVISLWNWRAINLIQTGLDSRLGQIDSRLAQVSGKVDTVAAQSKPAPRGPDPNRVYTINTAGSPSEGPAGAPITIAEFSDFQ